MALDILRMMSKNDFWYLSHSQTAEFIFTVHMNRATNASSFLLKKGQHDVSWLMNSVMGSLVAISGELFHHPVSRIPKGLRKRKPRKGDAYLTCVCVCVGVCSTTSHNLCNSLITWLEMPQGVRSNEPGRYTAISVPLTV